MFCSKWFANKGNSNRHVKALHQYHYTKNAYVNSTCTKGGCTRGVSWGIQTEGESSPFSKDISIKENEDSD